MELPTSHNFWPVSQTGDPVPTGLAASENNFPVGRHPGRIRKGLCDLEQITSAMPTSED